MKFEKLKNLSENKFRRITGVKRITFNQMVTIVQEACENKKKHKRAPGEESQNY